jgi:hypothetical protein
LACLDRPKLLALKAWRRWLRHRIVGKIAGKTTVIAITIFILFSC